MRPLNEYPKEELKDLLIDLMFCADTCKNVGLDKITNQWISRVKEAISDQEFEDKQLPFKKD